MQLINFIQTIILSYLMNTVINNKQR